MRFDDQVLDQVRHAISIVDLIGGYVRLRKSGQNHSALCPFHNEKTPSFLVSESKQIFKCFGCGVGGDIFKFVMLIENLSFPESVRYLAERAGIRLPQEDGSSREDADRRMRLLQLMQLSQSFFRECLLQAQEAGGADSYLRERGIETRIAELFGLGFAPPGNRLLRLLRERGFTLQEMEICGLVKTSPERGQPYDKFRNRLTFPIRDLSGKVIAFGGRALGDALPKYLNSPETPLYRKGSHLYGLNVSRDEIRRRDFAILVEGYFDCIVPYQFGFRNVVASLGTSLTQDQVKLLGRYTRKVVVNFDPDSAGQAAAMRSIDLFLEQGFHVNVLQLPPGEDPDSFLRRQGPEAYQEHLRTSVPYLEFLLQRFLAQERDPEGPKGKQQVVSSILPYLAKIPNRVERAEYVSRVASRLSLDEQILLAEMRKFAPGRQPPLQLSRTSPLQEPTPAERILLQALLENSLQAEVLQGLEGELVEGLLTEEIFRAALHLRNQNQEISVITLGRRLNDETQVHLLEKAALQSPATPLTREMIQVSIQALQEKQLKRLSLEIQREIQQLEQSQGTSSRLDELLRRKEKIRKQIEPNLV